MSLSPVQIGIRLMLTVVVVFATIQVGGWGYNYAYGRGFQKGRTDMLSEVTAKGEHRVAQNRSTTTNVVKRHKAQEKQREQYVTKLNQEIPDASADLSHCPVPPAAIKLWNEAPTCLLDPGSPGC